MNEHEREAMLRHYRHVHEVEAVMFNVRMGTTAFFESLHSKDEEEELATLMLNSEDRVAIEIAGPKQWVMVEWTPSKQKMCTWVWSYERDRYEFVDDFTGQSHRHLVDFIGAARRNYP